MKLSDKEMLALNTVLDYVYNEKLREDAPDTYEAYCVLAGARKEEDE